MTLKVIVDASEEFQWIGVAISSARPADANGTSTQRLEMAGEPAQAVGPGNGGGGAG
jgi:hypothetical protein